MLKLHGDYYYYYYYYYYYCLLGFCLCLSFFLFFYVSLLPPYAKDVALISDSLCLSRSCLASFRCPVSLYMCVPFFQRPLSSCAAPRLYRYLFAKPTQYYSSCSVVCWSYTAVFCLWFLRHLPTRYRVAFPSRSCNLTLKLLPCFMMGSVCPVHALYVWLCACWVWFLCQTSSTMYCDFCFWLFLWYVPGLFYVSDT